MEHFLDQSRPIRDGEELDLEQLQRFLKRRLPQFEGPLSVEQFPRGYSNLTYLLNIGPHQLVLRRPPFGNKVKSAHDMGREYRVLSKLWKVYPPAPRPFVYCDEASVLGAPFYIMERRQGVVIRDTLPEGLSLCSDTVRRLCESFVDNLALLHTLDYEAAGLGGLGRPQGYVERQIFGWTKRYQEARTDTVPAMERLSAWLIERMPPERAAGLIHNDYKYDNIQLDSNDLTRIISVFDWEMATLGDPLMDLGSTLAYWVEENDPPSAKQAAFGPTTLPGSLTRQEFVARYEEQTGYRADDILFYYCYGQFKLAVIIQQIYARFVRGHTTDERFATLNQKVNAIAEAGARALEAGAV